MQCQYMCFPSHAWQWLPLELTRWRCGLFGLLIGPVYRTRSFSNTSIRIAVFSEAVKGIINMFFPSVCARMCVRGCLFTKDVHRGNIAVFFYSPLLASLGIMKAFFGCAGIGLAGTSPLEIHSLQSRQREIMRTSHLFGLFTCGKHHHPSREGSAKHLGLCAFARTQLELPLGRMNCKQICHSHILFCTKGDRFSPSK